MLKDLLYGEDVFSVFCNWLALLGGFMGKLPKGSLDVYALTANSLLGALIVGLSSEDAALRRSCASILTWTVEECHACALQNDKLIQVYSALRLLQRSIDLSAAGQSQDQPRLSPIFALFFAQMMPILLSPEHAMFSTLAALSHDGPSVRLNRLPLFEELIRGTQIDPESIVDRVQYVRKLCWLLKVAEFGCKDRQDLAEGPMKWSHVPETAMTLFSAYVADAGKNAEAERVIGAVVKLLVKVKEVEAETVGLREWALMALDALKASTKQHDLVEIKAQLAQLL